MLLRGYMINSDRGSEGNLRAARFHGPVDEKAWERSPSGTGIREHRLVRETKRKLERTSCSDTPQRALLQSFHVVLLLYQSNTNPSGRPIGGDPLYVLVSNREDVDLCTL